jgi:hypothetical protein
VRSSDLPGGDPSQDGPASISRRQAMKKVAVTGAVAVWAIPTVQAIGISAAHAEDPSTQVKGTKHTRKPRTEVLGTQQQSGLPKTGSPVPVEGVAVAGAAAIVAGAAAVAASKRKGSTEES